MVFVHARNATLKTALVILSFDWFLMSTFSNYFIYILFMKNLRELAQQKNQLHMFQPEDNTAFGTAMRTVSKSRNKHFVDLFKDG